MKDSPWPGIVIDSIIVIAVTAALIAGAIDKTVWLGVIGPFVGARVVMAKNKLPPAGLMIFLLFAAGAALKAAFEGKYHA